MRLIDVDKLKEKLPSDLDLFMQVIGVRHCIDGAKTVKPESFVKCGKWIEDSHTSLTEDCFCGLCFWDVTFPKGFKKYRYCPNCGAKMDLEE